MTKILSTLFLMALIYSCSETDYAQGRSLYNSKCANCHMEDGSGLKGLIPPLAGADFLVEHRSDIPCYIRKGLSTPLLVNGERYTQQVMPAIPDLNEVEITNISNYILSAWGNQGATMKLEEVKKRLEGCE